MSRQIVKLCITIGWNTIALKIWLANVLANLKVNKIDRKSSCEVRTLWWRYYDLIKKSTWRIIIFWHKSSSYLLLKLDLRNIYEKYKKIEHKCTGQNEQTIWNTF